MHCASSIAYSMRHMREQAQPKQYARRIVACRLRTEPSTTMIDQNECGKTLPPRKKLHAETVQLHGSPALLRGVFALLRAILLERLDASTSMFEFSCMNARLHGRFKYNYSTKNKRNSFD